MIAPATTAVTLNFGAYGVAGYTKENPHAGVDFSWQNDRNIYAPEDAEVTYAGELGTAGQATNLVAGSHKHRMCHQSKILVAVGEQVKKGQVIGVMGETGAAMGVHLHWVMWINGVRVNGLDYVNEEGGGMSLTPGQLDRLVKMSLGRDPTREELNNLDFLNSPGLAIETLWNNGGEARFKQPDSEAESKLEAIKKIIN